MLLIRLTCARPLFSTVTERCVRIRPDRILTIPFVILVLLAISQPAVAIDGPGVVRIPDNVWGTANDVWPYVVRLEFDDNLSGVFGDSRVINGIVVKDEICSGTLIAPDVVVTAGHCFSSTTAGTLNVLPGAAVPAGRVRVNFGPGMGANQFVLNAGGRVNQVADRNPDDVAYVTLESPVAISPVAVIPTTPKAGNANFAVGFGVAPGNNGNNPQRIQIVQDGFRQHADAAKNWTEIAVDRVSDHFVEQFQQPNEDWTEVGDSGSPGLKGYVMPPRAFGNSIQESARGFAVMSAVSGGPTPTTADSQGGTINYPANPVVNSDKWTRLDSLLTLGGGLRQGDFLNEASSMRPIANGIQIYHNLPDADGFVGLDPNDQVAVLVKATFGNGAPYLLNLKVWDDDSPGNELLTVNSFTGDFALRPTVDDDDLLGYGHSGGKLPNGAESVCAWDVTTVASLLAYEEAGDPNEPPLDWTFQVNYASDLQFHRGSPNVHRMNLAGVQAQIADCQGSIQFGTAVRGGFALVPEPSSLGQLAAAVAILQISRRLI